MLNLGTASDQTVWEHAKTNGFTIVTLDKDFSDLSLLYGSPPKIIWMRCGNVSVVEIERLLRSNFDDIQNFDSSPVSTVLEIWP
jgi:predicted nuclease of predicted toxin-antitoxin system